MTARERAMGGTSRRRTEAAQEKYSQPKTYAEKQQSSDGRSAAIQEANRVRAEKAARDKAAADKAAATKADKTSLIQKAKNVVMKGEGDPSITKKSWAASGKVPAGQHKLRTQYDRLMAKYGPGWGKTTQAQELLNYLSGVSVTKGGGMGARDPGYGGGAFDMEDLTQEEFDRAEAYRQNILNEMGLGHSSEAGLAYLKNLDPKLARLGLSPDQYFNFRQQLMQSDVPAYEAAFPLSSGKAARGLGSLAMKGLSLASPVVGMAQKSLSPFLEKAQEGTMGLKSGLLSLFNKAKGVATPVGGGEGGQQFTYQPGPIGQEEIAPPSQGVIGGMPGISQSQGVIGGMPGMYQPGYGGSIGKENEVRTADFRDSDGDGVDDRDQAGPGQPYWRGSAGQGQKFATPGLPQAGLAPSALTPGSALAMSPLTHQLRFQPQQDWQQWFQNIGRFPGRR